MAISNMHVDRLPKQRTKQLVSYLDLQPVLFLLCIELILYCIIPLLVSTIEWICAKLGYPSVTSASGQIHNFADFLYFNFSTILTVGYGDLFPTSFGKALSIGEAIIGLVIFGIILAVTSIKVMQAPQDAIVFSKYGYYCTDEQSFLVIFVNTTRSTLINPEICSYYRRADQWSVRPAVRAPFIRGSVWTFFLEQLPLTDIVDGPDHDSSLRFGITGQLGLTVASAFVEYEPEDILVIPNRRDLVNFPGFLNADFSSTEVRTMFHYRPEGSTTLRDLFRRK